MHAVVMAASDEDVAAAWSAIRNRKDSAAWWTVASKLANRKTAPPEIVAELRRDLYEGNLGFNEIKDISTVRDRRIREWFRSQQNSEDENIARLARRVAGKPIRSPASVVISSTIPNRDGEVGSLEIDLEEAPQILREFRSTLGLKMPRWLLSPKGLEFLELDQWATIDLPSKSGAVYTLWLRLEDYDTIEIALTDDSAGDSARSVN